MTLRAKPANPFGGNSDCFASFRASSPISITSWSPERSWSGGPGGKETVLGEIVRWFKSPYSYGSGTEYVQVADLADNTAVRDSKDRGGYRLSFAHDCGRFAAGLRELELGC
ncbi:DUF397 domain-containing protein [Streptomyces scopuliridis]